MGGEAGHVNNFVADIGLPDSTATRAATEAAQMAEPALLFRHSIRVFLFASLIGRQRELDFDPCLLYVAAMFQDIGLTSAFRKSSRRFEVDGAEAVATFLAGHRFAPAECDEAWRAVALHMTFGIAKEMAPVTSLLAAGVETDLFGTHFDKVLESERQDIVAKFPRGPRFKERIVHVFARGMGHRPETAFGTVGADVLERIDPAYRRENFCGLILGSKWKD